MTGVQTCALPIYALRLSPPVPGRPALVAGGASGAGSRRLLLRRLEERRVGKKCRSREAP